MVLKSVAPERFASGGSPPRDRTGRHASAWAGGRCWICDDARLSPRSPGAPFMHPLVPILLAAALLPHPVQAQAIIVSPGYPAPYPGAGLRHALSSGNEADARLLPVRRWDRRRLLSPGCANMRRRRPALSGLSPQHGRQPLRRTTAGRFRCRPQGPLRTYCRPPSQPR